MVPEFENSPVVVAVPEPTSNVPVLFTVDPKNMFPVPEPRVPADVTAPLNLNVPDVDVTTLPAYKFVVPTTVKSPACMFISPDAYPVSVPRTVVLALKENKPDPPPLGCRTRLFKIVDPLKFKLFPAKRTVPD
jgi:hypothetical protein